MWYEGLLVTQQTSDVTRAQSKHNLYTCVHAAHPTGHHHVHHGHHGLLCEAWHGPERCADVVQGWEGAAPTAASHFWGATRWHNDACGHSLMRVHGFDCGLVVCNSGLRCA